MNEIVQASHRDAEDCSKRSSERNHRTSNIGTTAYNRRCAESKTDQDIDTSMVILGTVAENYLRQFASKEDVDKTFGLYDNCLLYTSPSPRDRTRSRMPSSA